MDYVNSDIVDGVTLNFGNTVRNKMVYMLMSDCT